jgi:hypothetical protein
VDEVELAVVDLLLPDTTQREVAWRAALGRGRWRILGAAEAELDIGDRNVARRPERERERQNLALPPALCQVASGAQRGRRKELHTRCRREASDSEQLSRPPAGLCSLQRH